MRVELQIIAGPELGRVIRVGGRELLSIGRTDRADVALANDAKLSQAHFEIETDQQFCRLRDLGSANGTAVNGEVVEKYVLQSGDKIVAGETTFLVKLDGGADSAELAAIRTSLSAVAAKAPPTIAPGKKKKVALTAEDCASGLKLFRGNVDDMQPGHVAELLGRKTPLYLLVDFRRLETPPPKELDPPPYFFDWLPPEAQSAVSPLLFGYADYPESFELVGKAWGEDALVGFFSTQDPVDLRAHLRKEARPDKQSIMGICWPSALSPLLQFFKPSVVEKLLEGVESVLVEFPDLPETWQIFARPGYEATLEGAGFEISTQPPPADGENKE